MSSDAAVDAKAERLAAAGIQLISQPRREMRDLDEMMRGIGRLMKQNVELGWGPGRHTARHNTFAYFKSPAGNVLEYTAEVERVDDSTWTPTIYPAGPDITDQWGTDTMHGNGPQNLGKPPVDPGSWIAPPR